MGKYIYLDVGNTILHLRKPPHQIYVSIFQKYKLLTEDHTPDHLVQEFRASWKSLEEKLDPNLRDRYCIHPKGHAGWWIDLIDGFLRRVQINFTKPSEEVYNEIFSAFDDISIWEIDHGFFDLVHFIKQNNMGFGIISNWDNRLRNLLTRLDIIKHFDHVLVSAEFGYEKPSPLIFQAAEKLSGKRNIDLYYVGDKPELDYYPPRNLGWNSFLISRQEVNGFDQIQNLAELIPHISDYRLES